MIEGALIAARFFQFAATSVLFGSSLFVLYAFEGELTPPVRWAWPKRALLIAGVIAFLATLAWLMAETALLGESADATNPAAVWTIAWDTSFGRVVLVRLAQLFVCVVCVLMMPPSRTLWMTQALFAGAALTSFAWSGHGIYDDGFAGALHTGADVLHLLSAGIWIGALFVFCALISTARTDDRTTYQALERFSGIGPAVVALLVLTGLVNSWFLIGLSHLGAVFTTSYGLLLVAKLGFFAGMLALAAGNRFYLTPRLGAGLRGDDVARAYARQALRSSLFAETVLALLVVGAVAYLGNLEPPIASD